MDAMDAGTLCPFCAASSGQAVSRIVMTTPTTIALHPRRGAAIGHTLVVPRRHVAYLWSMDGEEAASLFDSVQRVARAVWEAIKPEGLSIVNSTGAAASHTVEHLHVHVVPRWNSDGIGAFWPDEMPHIPGEERDRAAEAIRAALGS